MTAPSQLPAGVSASGAATVNKTSLIIGGLGLVAIGALAAVLLTGHRAPVADPAAAQVAAPALVAASSSAPAMPAPPAEPAPAVIAAPPKPVAATPTPNTEPAPGVRTEAAAPAPEPAPAPAPKVVAASKPVCSSCGVVSAVTPVQKKGEAGALGTVAGGVVGGVLGHQMGGGSGKTAMTVIGTVGGAMAGREVEKRHGTTTEYQMSVRMNDGSTRTFTRSQPMAVGQRVLVDGNELTVDTAPAGSR